MMVPWECIWSFIKLQLSVKRNAFLDALLSILIFHTSSCWIQEEKHCQFLMLSVSVFWFSIVWETQSILYGTDLQGGKSPFNSSSWCLGVVDPKTLDRFSHKLRVQTLICKVWRVMSGPPISPQWQSVLIVSQVHPYFPWIIHSSSKWC